VIVISIPYNIIVRGQDANPPLIDITSPNPCTDIPGSNEIIVEGTASDQESEIEKVEAFAHTLPFNNQFPYELAEQINNNWSNWKITLNVTENEPFRISARVTDKSGNENWDDVTITARPEILPETNNTKIKIAFVHPTFTSTAYSPDSFYTFYDKYESVNETASVDLLKTALNPSEDRAYYQPFINSISNYSSDISIKILRDQDVDNGAIFVGDNQTNAFDAVVLVHNEYLTEKEYYNLRKYVENGGRLILIDGNVFYAEVKYDPKNCAIELLNGHGWTVRDGIAKKGPDERWLKENREWMGSNFLFSDIAEPVKFKNNPFNYSHFEENFISNKNASILLDYLAEIPITVMKDNNLTISPHIATYELDVGKGKVIAVGLYGTNLAFDNKFIDFFIKTVLQHSVGYHKTFDYAGEKFPIYWNVPGNISHISLDKGSKSISLDFTSLEGNLEDNSNNQVLLLLSLPKKLIDSPELFNVVVNKQAFALNTSRNDIENVFEVPIGGGTNMITIKGEFVSPSFTIEKPADVIANATGQYTSVELSPPIVKNVSDNEYLITDDSPEIFPWGKTIVNWTVTHDGETDYEKQTVTILDKTQPDIDITSCMQIPGSNEIIVEGTASDQESEVEKVEAFAHTLPFNNQFPYELAEQINNNWSNWKITLNVTENEPFRISARVTDNAGNENWDGLTIDPSSDRCNNIS
jgi:phage-related protein